MPLVIAALPIETKKLKKYFDALHRVETAPPLRLFYGQIENKPLALALTGMGKKNVRKAFTEILKQLKPSAIFSVGLAGGLHPELGIADLLIASHITPLTQTKPPGFGKAAALSIWQNPHPVLNHLEHALKETSRVKMGGLLLSADAIVSFTEDKKAIFSQLPGSFPYAAVDMETHALFLEIEKAGLGHVPFLSVRAISDTIDDNLDMPFGRFFTAEGDLRLRPFLAYLFQHPRLAGRFWRLNKACDKATDQMALAFLSLIKHSDFFWQRASS